MNRIGKVSGVDYMRGMVRVTYPDREGMVTDWMPTLSLTGEYRMPSIGERVMVCQLSAGGGVAMGKVWDGGSSPREGAKGLFLKELGDFPGEAYIRCEGGQVEFHDESGTVSLSEIVGLLRG